MLLHWLFLQCWWVGFCFLFHFSLMFSFLFKHFVLHFLCMKSACKKFGDDGDDIHLGAGWPVEPLIEGSSGKVGGEHFLSEDARHIVRGGKSWLSWFLISFLLGAIWMNICCATRQRNDDKSSQFLHFNPDWLPPWFIVHKGFTVMHFITPASQNLFSLRWSSSSSSWWSHQQPLHTFRQQQVLAHCLHPPASALLEQKQCRLKGRS